SVPSASTLPSWRTVTCRAMLRTKSMSCSTTTTVRLPESSFKSSAVRSISWCVIPATGSSTSMMRGFWTRSIPISSHCFCAREIDAVTDEVHGPLVRPRLASDYVHQGRFARAVRSDETAELTLVEDQRELVQRLEPVEAHADVVDVERRLAALEDSLVPGRVDVLRSLLRLLLGRGLRRTFDRSEEHTS